MHITRVFRQNAARFEHTLASSLLTKSRNQNRKHKNPHFKIHSQLVFKRRAVDAHTYQFGTSWEYSRFSWIFALASQLLSSTLPYFAKITLYKQKYFLLQQNLSVHFSSKQHSFRYFFFSTRANAHIFQTVRLNTRADSPFFFFHHPSTRALLVTSTTNIFFPSSSSPTSFVFLHKAKHFNDTALDDTDLFTTYSRRADAGNDVNNAPSF